MQISIAASLLLAAFTDIVITSPLPLSERSSPYPVSLYSSSLTRSRSANQPSSQRLRDTLLAGQATLYSEYFDLSFLTNLTLGGQEFLVIVDTGSSDTWLAPTGYTCVNITTNETVSQATCGFASTFTPGSTFQQIPDENFNISYGSGEYLNGILGYETVTLAGIQVSKQEIGLPYLAGFQGDNITSGLTGLAYPDITSGFAGTNPSADNVSSPVSFRPYSPIINTIFYVDNLTQPLFSLALSRDTANGFGFGGYLTIGGVPETSFPSVNASDSYAVVSLEPLTVLSPKAPDEFAYYLILIDELVYGPFAPGDGEISGAPFIVDSGTTLNYLPTDDADYFNSLFDPPAVYIGEIGAYVVDCNATAPDLGVAIGGETFYHNPVDLIYNTGSDGLCLSGVNDGGPLESGLFILGDVFLKNVLAVFDVGNVEMAFSSRMYYATGGAN